MPCRDQPTGGIKSPSDVRFTLPRLNGGPMHSFREYETAFLIFLMLTLLGVSALGAKTRAVGHSPSLHAPPTIFQTDNPATAENAAAKLNTALKRTTAKVGPLALMMMVDGRTVYQKGIKGSGDQDVFVTASSAKWLIAATVMTLVDEGWISLDDPVSRFLPEFEDEKSGITVRHLLSHTSGLPPNVKRHARTASNLETSVTYIGKNVRLTSEPGTRFCYGNLSFQVAARIAEVVTGRAWPEVFNERIATPVGMMNTHFPAKGRGSGLYLARTTLSDYVRFLTMFQHEGISATGNRVLSRSAVAEMKRDQTENMAMECIDRRLHRKMGRMSYGLGLWREQINPQTGDPEVVSHFGTSGFRGTINYRYNYAIAMAYKKQRGKDKWLLARHYENMLSLINRLANTGRL